MIGNGYYKSLLPRTDSIFYISMRRFLMIFNVLRIINNLCLYPLDWLISLYMPEVVLFFGSPHRRCFLIIEILLSLKWSFWVSLSDNAIHLYWLCFSKFGRSFNTWIHPLSFMSFCHLSGYLLMGIEEWER